VNIACEKYDRSSKDTERLHIGVTWYGAFENSHGKCEVMKWGRE
jgi:hypothetical protein